MNCKDVQEIMPLYAGCDLEERSMKAVAEHLFACDECAHLEVEYSETMRMFQEFALPVFNETVFTGIRQNVMYEIEQRSTARGFLQSVADVLSSRFRITAAAALLLVVSTIAIYFVANHLEGGSEFAGERSNGHAKQPDRGVQIPDMPAFSQPPSQIRNLNAPDAAKAGSVTTPVHSQPQQTLNVYPPTAARRRISPELDRTRNKIDPSGVTASGNNMTGVASSEPTASEPTLRMEIQTKDPNIRIIWFANPVTKQVSQ